MGHPTTFSEEERTMSSKNDPEAARPTTVQSSDLSVRNKAVMRSGHEGGQVESPSSAESRVTPEGPAISPDAGA